MFRGRHGGHHRRCPSEAWADPARPGRRDHRDDEVHHSADGRGRPQRHLHAHHQPRRHRYQGFPGSVGVAFEPDVRLGHQPGFRPSALPDCPADRCQCEERPCLYRRRARGFRGSALVLRHHRRGSHVRLEGNARSRTPGCSQARGDSSGGQERRLPDHRGQGCDQLRHRHVRCRHHRVHPERDQQDPAGQLHA